MAAAVRWIDDDQSFAEVLQVLGTVPALCLDTEFHRERSYWPHLALVQLGWEDEVVLVDPFKVDLRPFGEILAGPVTTVAHAADQDLEVLDRACGASPSSLFDTQIAAGFLGLTSPSLSTLTDKLLGIRLPKGDRLTDWTQRPLTADQQSYAASDVAHLLDLHRSLTRSLHERGRLAWAEQECDMLLHRPRGPQDPETAWWRLKDARSFRGRTRGVARSVAAWRERRAAELDIPPRFVLSDLALVAIAHRPPSSLAELQTVRGLDSRAMRTVGEALLTAVRAGVAADDTTVAMPPADELERRLRPAVSLAAAWVGQLAAEIEIDAALLATRADLLALLRGDADARLRAGWRRDLVGHRVERLVRGDAALAFNGRGGLILEERSHRAIRGPVAGDVPSEPAPDPNP